jgi:RNA polymerase sigma factor (sigma-70 family)
MESSGQVDKVSRAAGIFERYGGFIWEIICWKADDENSFEDLYQEIFIHIAAKPVPENAANIKGYLYRMVCHKIIDYTRKKQSYSKNIKKYEKKYDYTVNGDTAENDLITEEQFNNMLEIIGKELPTRHSKAIIMRYQKQLSTAEIADKMGVTGESVNHYICVGLKKLRSILRMKR